MKHGAELKLSTLKETLSSKSLIAITSIATFSLLLGEPLAATGATVVGAIIELGKLSVNFAEKKTSMMYSAKNSEISYLYDLRRSSNIK